MPLNILRGIFRGATRGVMTGKRGNKNFYKGMVATQVSLISRLFTTGKFAIKAVFSWYHKKQAPYTSRNA